MSHKGNDFLEDIEITHKREPDLFCDCEPCVAFFTAKAEAMRIWQNATAEDTTDQAKEDNDYYQELSNNAHESAYFSKFTD